MTWLQWLPVSRPHQVSLNTDVVFSEDIDRNKLGFSHYTLTAHIISGAPKGMESLPHK
jgi:hypothetical protein